MNVYHVINRNKFAKPKIVIENVVSIKFHYYFIKHVHDIHFSIKIYWNCTEIVDAK